MREISYLYELSLGGVDRLRVEATLARGEVKNFVVQYEAFFGEQWRPIIRYDTAHGFAHRDICHAARPPEKQLLLLTDYNDAFTFAIDDILAFWQRYRLAYEEERSNDK